MSNIAYTPPNIIPMKVAENTKAYWYRVEELPIDSDMIAALKEPPPSQPEMSGFHYVFQMMAHLGPIFIGFTGMTFEQFAVIKNIFNKMGVEFNSEIDEFTNVNTTQGSHAKNSYVESFPVEVTFPLIVRQKLGGDRAFDFVSEFGELNERPADKRSLLDKNSPVPLI